MADNTGRDRTEADVGDDAGQAAIGKGNQQQSSDNRSRPRQDMRGGDTYFGKPDDMQVWVRLLDMAAQIREITAQMDRLERTEVVVRPGPEVVIRPSTPAPVPDSVNLSVRVIFAILILALVLVVALVVVLIFLRVSNV